MIIEGKVWKFGDNISTDLIAPGRLFYLRSNLPELAKHVMEDTRPGFFNEISPGDIIVGGENFGLGSSREHAPTIIKIAGINAILAKSFARIFFRNCINIGLPAIVCNTENIDEGNLIRIDIEAGKVINRKKDIELPFNPFPPVMAMILKDGGLVEHIKKNRGLKLV